MVTQGSGAIVNVASVDAFFQPDGATIDYGAAKSAVVNITKALAQELGPQGIRINAVSPGPVATDLWLGPNGVAQTAATAMGVDVDTARGTCRCRHRGIRYRELHDPRAGRRPRRLPRIGPNRQRHWGQLRHRRRPHQDHLSLGSRSLEVPMPAITVAASTDAAILPALGPTERPRPVLSVTTAPSGFEGEGFPVRRAFAGVELAALDPFIHLDQMGEVDYPPGRPRAPRGIPTEASRPSPT